MIMPGQVVQILAIGLAGLAAAGFVPAPARRLRRIEVWSPGGLRWRLPALLRARQDALALRVRITVGLVALVVVPWMLQACMPSLGPASWLTGPIGAVLAIVALGRAESPAARRRRERMTLDLPHLLELMAAAMEAGLPLRNATREVVAITTGPLTDDLAELMTNIELGRSDADAWRSLHAHPVLDRVALDLARSVESGTAIASALRQHALAARQARRGALEARARTVGVKSVPPLVSCFVPAFLLIGIVPTGAALFQSFLT